MFLCYGIGLYTKGQKNKIILIFCYSLLCIYRLLISLVLGSYFPVVKIFTNFDAVYSSAFQIKRLLLYFNSVLLSSIFTGVSSKSKCSGV